MSTTSKSKGQQATQPAENPEKPGSEQSRTKWKKRHGIVGSSEAIREVINQTKRYAERSKEPILLVGERGTGKELLARLIHAAGPNKGAPFYTANCATLVPDRAESDFFGHNRGSFSGATLERKGWFEQAGAGILFLDEVERLGFGTQGMLLRVLQEKEYRKLGGDRTLKAKARVVAATNVDLVAACNDGYFARDLYDRLSMLEIGLPALRARGQDVLEIAQYLLDELVPKGSGKPSCKLQFTEAAKSILLRHRWVGNVRELSKVVTRAIVNHPRIRETVQAQHLLPYISPPRPPATSLRDTRCILILEVLGARRAAFQYPDVGPDADLVDERRLSSYLGLPLSSLRRCLQDLIEFGLVAEVDGRTRLYRLNRDFAETMVLFDWETRTTKVRIPALFPTDIRLLELDTIKYGYESLRIGDGKPSSTTTR